MSNQLHSVLRFRQSGSIVQLQPFRGQDIDGDTLSIDLATGSIRVQKQVCIPTYSSCRYGCVFASPCSSRPKQVAWQLCATPALLCHVQDKLDKNFDIAFGIAGLAQLATGFALALIIAGENVSCDCMEVTMCWVLGALTMADANQERAGSAVRTADGGVMRAGRDTEGAPGVEGHQDGGADRQCWRQPRRHNAEHSVRVARAASSHACCDEHHSFAAM